MTPGTRRRLARFTSLALMFGALAAVGAASLCGAEFTLGPYFTDNMVLQKPERALGGTFIWARTDLDERISVEFQGKETRSAVENGIWRVKLADLDATLAPSDLVIRNRAKRELVRLTNVVVGEVWVLGIPTPAIVDFRVGWLDNFVRTICFANPDEPSADRRLRVAGVPSGTGAAGATEWHVVQPDDCRSLERAFSNDAAHLAHIMFINSSNAVRYVGIIEVSRKQVAGLLPVGVELPSAGNSIGHGFVSSQFVWPSVRDSAEARRSYFAAVASLKRVGLVTNAPPPVQLSGPQQYSPGRLPGLDFTVRGCMW